MPTKMTVRAPRMMQNIQNGVRLATFKRTLIDIYPKKSDESAKIMAVWNGIILTSPKSMINIDIAAGTLIKNETMSAVS